MSTPQFPATPAPEQDQSHPIHDPHCAQDNSAAASSSGPGGWALRRQTVCLQIDEEDLLAPAELIEQQLRRLSHRLHEVELAKAWFLAPVLAEVLLPSITELMAMHAALRVGMSVDQWSAILLRSAVISCELGALHDVLCAYMDSVGFAWTDEPDPEPTGR